MAEELGDAILRLRTDDTAFSAGVDKAEVQASGLGKTLDLTSGSAVGLADKLDQAAKSGDRGAQAFLKASASIEQLAQAQTTSKNEINNAKAALDAGTISMDRYNKEVLESKAALAVFEDEHRRAQIELRNYLRTSDQVTTASGAQRAGLNQLTQQVGDMTLMYSMGARPSQIFATQIGQTTQAIQLMAGEGSKFAAFIANPWVQGIMIGTAILGPLIANLFSAGEEAEGAAGKIDGLTDALKRLHAEQANSRDIGQVQGEINRLRDERMKIDLNMPGRAGLQARNRAASLDAQIASLEQEIRWQGAVDAANADLKKTKEKTATSKAAKAPAMATESDQAAALASLDREYLQAKLAVTTDAQERAAIEDELLVMERAQRLAAIDNNKKLTEAQRAERKAAVERIFGREISDGQIPVSLDPAHLKLQRQREQQDAQLANDMLSRRAETVQAWAQLAMTTDERLKLERQALELQEQIQRNMLEQQIANGQIADADKARAELASQQAAAREGLERQGAGPLEVYVNNLRADRAETGRLVEGLIVDELDYVHRTITDSIADRLGVKDPFLRGLIAMFVQQQLIQPMAEALQSMMNGMGGGGGGFFGTVLGGLGKLFGGGNGGFLSGLVSSANSWIDGGGQLNLSGASGLTVNAADNAAFAGFFAEGGTIGPGEWGFAGENGIEPVFGGTTGVSVMSNPDARRMFGGDSGQRAGPYFDLRGAVMTEDLLRQMNAISREHAASSVAAYDSVVGDRVQEHLARFG